MEADGLVSVPPIMLPWSKGKFSAERKKTCPNDIISQQQETLVLVGAAEHNESKPKANQGRLLMLHVVHGRPSYHHASRKACHFNSLPSKPIGKGSKAGEFKVDDVFVV
ncbi:60S ribosomal protein L2 [Nymphaea thermarum]|nr:60S ribosomal protein L2 [Nymphaea thermarum]